MNAGAALRSGLRRVAGPVARRLAPSSGPGARRIILCYHSVDPAGGYQSISPALFDAHLTWLERHCRVVSLTDLLRGRDLGGRPSVAITFDDGYADNGVHVAPRLASRGMTATFFLTAGFLERDQRVMTHLSRIWDTPVRELAPLSWEEVAEMAGRGMTFGSHTWSHRNLARLADPEATEELIRSRQLLEARLAAPVTAVAYPWGKPRRHVTDRTFAAAARAGYELGFISLPRAVGPADGPLAIPRFGIGNEPVGRLAAKVGGAIDWHGWAHERMPSRLDRVLSRDAAPFGDGSA